MVELGEFVRVGRPLVLLCVMCGEPIVLDNPCLEKNHWFCCQCADPELRRARFPMYYLEDL